MSNAKSAVEVAAYTALAAAITGAGVYQDTPDGVAGDLVILGDMKSARLPGKDSSADRRVTLSIVTIVEAQERAPLLALQEQCDDVLDGATLEAPGWTIRGEFIDDDAVLGDDGVTYNGVATYVFFALAD